MQKKCVRRVQHYPCSRSKITYSAQIVQLYIPPKTLDLLHASSFLRMYNCTILHCCINYIQQCSIVQLCILRKLEAFCMPDVGGHVISREFSRDVQLNHTHAICDFTVRVVIMNECCL